MNGDLGSTAQVFGMGSGIFFVGYVLFEVPGALISERWSSPMWIARIMINWGFISGGGHGLCFKRVAVLPGALFARSG